MMQLISSLFDCHAGLSCSFVLALLYLSVLLRVVPIPSNGRPPPILHASSSASPTKSIPSCLLLTLHFKFIGQSTDRWTTNQSSRRQGQSHTHQTAAKLPLGRAAVRLQHVPRLAQSNRPSRACRVPLALRCCSRSAAAACAAAGAKQSELRKSGTPRAAPAPLPPFPTAAGTVHDHRVAAVL